jgi:hypothetical protein
MDGNGKLDIVATTIDDLAYIPADPFALRKGRYSIYAWELDSPFVNENMVWPAFQRNSQHTGYLPPPVPINQTPVVSGIPNQLVRSGATFFPIELDGYVEDPDDPFSGLTWSVTGPTVLEAVITPDRVLRVAPPHSDWAGADTLTITASDSGGLSSSIQVTFSARVDYEPPVARPDRARLPEDGSAELDVLANDSHPKALPLRILSTSRPMGGTVQNHGDGLTYRPHPDFFGEDEFAYTIVDDEGGMAMARVFLRVQGVEDAPIALPDGAATDEDVPLEIDVLANDRDPDHTALSLVGATQPAGGRVTVTDTGKLLYEPAKDQFGLETLEYDVVDETGRSATGEVMIRVNPVNDAPVAKDLVLDINRNSQVDVIFAAVDPDDDPLEFTVLKAPDHGELWNYPDIATYYPEKGFTGTDTFTYKAEDRESESRIATVTLNVLAQNNPPKPEDQELVTRLDQPLEIHLNAEDLDDDPLSFEILTLPVNGDLTGSSTNYLYTPNLAFLGEDRFTFHAHDGIEYGAEGTVLITVTDQNTAPEGITAHVEVRLNTDTPITLQGRDNEGDPLAFTLTSEPQHGTLSGDPPELTFTPDSDYLGPDRFAFVVSDGELTSEPATVSVKVVPLNRTPEAEDQTIRLEKDLPTLLELDLLDADGDPLRCAILKGPQNGRLAGTDVDYTYTPRTGFVGRDRFTYKAWDGVIYSRIATVTLFVREPVVVEQPSFESIELLDASATSLRLRAQPGAKVRVQASLDLLEWETVETLTPVDEYTTVVLPDEANAPHRYYRAIQEP